METSNVYLGTTRDGKKVYDRKDTHIHEEQGITKKLIRTALSRVYSNGRMFRKVEVRFNEPIGLTTCVEVTPKDEVVMVYRKGRAGLTPMVKGRSPESCNIFTIMISKNKDDDNYTLVTCFVGAGSMREPWDKGIKTEEERLQCEKYWSTHALVYNPDLIDWTRMKIN